MKPKKCMSMNYFFKTYENKAEWEKKNNKNVELVENYEIEEEEEDQIKVSNDESKMIKAKVIKNKKKEA